MLLPDLKRSCERGLGGPRHADALNLGAYEGAVAFRHASVAYVPEAIVVGSCGLLRESELANLRVRDITLLKGTGCGSISIHSSASKTDWRARGCVRTLCCTCLVVCCPVKAVSVLVDSAKEFDDFLVRTHDGQFVSKQMMVAAMKCFAKHIGQEGRRITGHSLRTTGAQAIAAAGMSDPRIAIFGR